MRHLFVIQCCKYEPAKALGELINRISPVTNGVQNWDVFYAYDTNSTESPLLSTLPNSKGFTIGYYTTDQGLSHLLLWEYLGDSSYYDYYHIISESDLPFKGIYRVDDLVKNFDAYGFINKSGFIRKSIAFYGLSRKVVEWISRHVDLLTHGLIDVWLQYKHTSKLTGGPDEYMIGYLLSKIEALFNFRNESLRLVYFPDPATGYVKSTDNVLIELVGKLSPCQSSPVILELTPSNKHAFENEDILFGRKFEFESETYNYFTKSI